MPRTDRYIETYNSFAGTDIKAVFDDVIIGSLQGITWSITREKAPIYTLGSPNPRAFNRGKRGIAGTLIFIMFDRDALLYAMSRKRYLADRDEGRVYTSLPPMHDTMLRFDQLDLLADPRAATAVETTMGPANFDQEVREPYYADQIPPFNITIVGANEYGAMSVMRIFGVEILNAGSGVSIDDLVLEQVYTYVAREMTVMIPQQRVDLTKYYGSGSVKT